MVTLQRILNGDAKGLIFEFHIPDQRNPNMSTVMKLAVSREVIKRLMEMVREE